MHGVKFGVMWITRRGSEALEHRMVDRHDPRFGCGSFTYVKVIEFLPFLHRNRPQLVAV
jgi:hypothetical protein